jgi:hypothetical protein
MFHLRGQTTRTPTTRRASASGRPRSILLALALLAALGAPLAGAAPAAGQAAARLELTPARALTEVKRPIRYTAELVAAGNSRQDVTSGTTLRFDGPAPCHMIAPGQVSCDDNGPFKVTGVFGKPRITSDPADLQVVNRRVGPAFESVPAPSPPNSEAAVQGLTGSCGQEGTLSSKELAVSQQVTGFFTASFRIPAGTFPRTYPLALDVTCDGKPLGVTADIEVRNRSPEAVNDQAATTPDRSVTIPVTVNDTDPDGDDGYRTVLEADPPTLGTAVVKDQTIEYTPGPGFVDHDQFTYRNCDVVDAAGRRRDCGGATVTVTREQPEPEAVDDPNERTERDRQVDIDVMKNDGHPDAARLQVLPDPAPKGEAVVQPDGAIRYTPEPGATGKDSIGYDYCRPVVNLAARAACDPATVTVDVRPPPQIKTVAADPTPPNKEVVVTGTTGSCQEGTLTLRIPPPGKDVPVAVTAAQDGTFTARLKVPKGTSVGTYALVLGVDCDGRPRGTRRPLRVGNQPPDAVDDPASTPQDTPVVIDVTANDTDPDGDDGYTTSLEAAKPANGTTEVLSGDRIRYTPDRGFAGVDPFTYRLCEVVNAKGKRDCDTATVTVTVIGRRRPVPVDDPDETTLRDRPVVIEVMKNDRNPDAAVLEVGRPTRSRASAEEQPDGTVRYTPEPGFTGTDTFPYDYCGGAVDVTAACPSATVTVTVTAEPVISSVEPGSTAPGRPVTVRGSTGSCNRTGTLTLQGTGAAVTVTGDQDGGFTASLPVPAGTFPGSYTLELRVDCKGRLQRVERPLVVTNQAPVAADDPASTVRDRPVTIRVAGNDRDPDDPDGYRTLVVVTSPPVRGSAEPQPDLTVVYTPQPGFVGVDRFRYGLCDDVVNRAGQADCGIATVTVTVTDTPAISSVTPGSTSPGRPVQVAGNTGSCSRTGTLTFSGAADLRMRVTGDQSGSFTTTVTVPAGTFPGVYELELGVDCRGQVQRAEAQLTVANQAPDPADDEATTPSGTATTIEVTGNDRDPDDPDTYRTLVVVAEQPGHGTAEARPDLSVVYTPDEGFAGTDRFRYGLCDDVVNAAGQADCGTATVTVRVDPVACAPSERDNPSLRVEPARGSGGTRLHITAAVARTLATCQFRLLLGGTPLPPDVSVRGDGSISADRGVPPNVKPGPNPMRLTTLTAETLAQTPFEVVGAPSPPPPPPNWPVRLLLSAGALAAGFLGRAAFRKWGKGEEGRSRDRPVDLPDDLRVEPHTRPVEATVEPVPDNSRTLAVRLEPHPDSGIQTLEEVTR